MDGLDAWPQRSLACVEREQLFGEEEALKKHQLFDRGSLADSVDGLAEKVDG